MIGEIVSEKMKKTRVVKAHIIRWHPKYHKQHAIDKRYKAHDEKEEYHVGDIVEIKEMRPMSREKRWKIIRKVK